MLVNWPLDRMGRTSMQWGMNALISSIATLAWILLVGHYRNSACIFGIDRGDQPWCDAPLMEPLTVYAIELLILFGVPVLTFFLLEWAIARLSR